MKDYFICFLNSNSYLADIGTLEVITYYFIGDTLEADFGAIQSN